MKVKRQRIKTGVKTAPVIEIKSSHVKKRTKVITKENYVVTTVEQITTKTIKFYHKEMNNRLRNRSK